MSEDHGFGGGGEDYRGTSRRSAPSHASRSSGPGEDLGSGRGEDLSGPSRSRTKGAKQTRSSDLEALRNDVHALERKADNAERSDLLRRKKAAEARLKKPGLP